MHHSDNKANMVAASFLLALVSIATFQVFFVSLPCASVSILLALLSRGDGPMTRRAKRAVACAIAGAALTTTVTISSVYAVMHDPELKAQVEQIYQSLTDPAGSNEDGGSLGQNSQDLLKEILSGSYREQKQEAPGSHAGSVPEGKDGRSGDNLI